MLHSRTSSPDLAETGTRTFQSSLGLVATLVCAVLVGWLGSTFHPRLLLLLPGLIILIVVGVVWPWLTILPTRGELRFAQDRIHEHDQIEAHLHLHNRAPWPAWGLFFEIDAASRFVVEATRSFSTTVSTLSLRPHQRGILPSRSLRLLSAFPIGLLLASRRIDVKRPLIVWPRVFPVAAPPSWTSADMSVGHVDSRRIGNAGDTIGVRAYRRGDPMRWIHWPQTARHDRFMVREFQASSIPRVRLVLDCEAVSHVGEGPDSSFEWAIRIAASLACGWLDEGAEVELVAGSLRLPAAGGKRHRESVLDALAGVQFERGAGRTVLPKGELATVFISTDIGWQSSSRSGSHGFSLRCDGFGGSESTVGPSGNDVVHVAHPDEVPSALLRFCRGGVDAA